MKCDENYFFNKNAGGCFSCSDICDLKGTGNSKDYCLKVCPEYKLVQAVSQTPESNTASHLEIILPAVCLVLIASIILGVVLIRKHRERRRRNLLPVVYTPRLKMTKEEVGDVEEIECLDDSGIDTTRDDVESEESSQINDNTHQEETQTGLSELYCNSIHLKNASDASGAQAV